jgi:hypothetical protein
MEWAQTASIVAVFAGVIGLQSFWIARSLDALRSEMHHGFDKLERRLERLEEREPPSLRRA